MNDKKNITPIIQDMHREMLSIFYLFDTTSKDITFFGNQFLKEQPMGLFLHAAFNHLLRQPMVCVNNKDFCTVGLTMEGHNSPYIIGIIENLSTHSIPIIQTTLIKRLRIVYYILKQKSYEEQVSYVNLEMPQASPKNKQLAPQKTQHEYTHEKLILIAITEGNQDHFLQLLQNFQYDISKFVLSKTDLLRHQKNLLIAFITLAARAAIAGGAFSDDAYCLNDQYIQHLETIQSIFHLERFIKDIGLQFIDLVRRSQQQLRSKTVYSCQDYIAKNIYHRITLNQLAQHAFLHPSQLSTKFKKEMQISISDYILQQRIKQAKILLRYYNHTSSEIASMLQFSDQSHFIRVFKKLEGTTPKKYREKYSGSLEFTTFPM